MRIRKSVARERSSSVVQHADAIQDLKTKVRKHMNLNLEQFYRYLDADYS